MTANQRKALGGTTNPVAVHFAESAMGVREQPT
jgi:hypothetical protein